MQRKLAVMLAALFAVLMVPLTARAADCDSRVVDGAGVYGPGFSQVDAAAGALAAKGATVRVRTVTNYGGFANLDQYEASLIGSCPSWQGANGRIKNNLIVFMISSGAKVSVGIWYGSTWSGSLATRWPTIQTQDVNPYLSSKGPNGQAKNRDFVGGTVNGLNSIAASLAAQPASPSPQTYPPPQTYPTPVQPAPQQHPAPPPVIVNQQPGPDHTVLWVSVLVGLLAAGVLIWFLLSRKAQREIANAAQQKAKVAKNGCSSKINEMEEDVGLLPARVNKLAGLMSEEDVAPLREAADAIKSDYGNASSRYADLSSSATDPDKDGLSAGEYEQIAAGFNGVLTDLEGVRAAKVSFETKASALERTIGQAPTQIKDAETAIATATTEVGEVEKTGFKVEGPNAVLKEAGSFLDQARAALAGKRFGQVAGASSKAQDKAKAASKAAKALAQTKVDADAAVTALTTRIESVAGKVSSGKTTFQQLSAAYVESSWSDVRSNANDADGKVAEARKFLAAATTAASMEKQNWAASATAVQNGNGALDSAEASVKAIVVRKALLVTAQTEAKGDVEQAGTDNASARAYATEHAADIRTSVAADLNAADAAVAAGKSELAKAKPDYLAAKRSAEKARSKTAAALTSAKDQVRAADELRAKAAKAVSDASEHIGTVAGYITANADVTLDATTALRDARATLARAQAASTLVSRIELADAAKAKAEAVHATAQGQVRAANERREAARLAELERQRLAAEAEALRLQRIREQEQRDADAAAALLTGAVIGASIASSGRSDSSERRQSRDDDDDAGRYGGGGSTDVDDSSDDSGSSGGGGSTDVDDSSSSNDDSSGGGGSSDVD